MQAAADKERARERERALKEAAAHAEKVAAQQLKDREKQLEYQRQQMLRFQQNAAAAQQKAVLEAGARAASPASQHRPSFDAGAGAGHQRSGSRASASASASAADPNAPKLSNKELMEIEKAKLLAAHKQFTENQERAAAYKRRHASGHEVTAALRHLLCADCSALLCAALRSCNLRFVLTDVF
jgi:hypothetical protein